MVTCEVCGGQTSVYFDCSQCNRTVCISCECDLLGERDLGSGSRESELVCKECFEEAGRWTETEEADL